MQAKLVVISGPDQGRVFALAEGKRRSLAGEKPRRPGSPIGMSRDTLRSAGRR